MSEFIPWDSQPLAAWAARYAEGQLIELDGKQTHCVVKGSGQPVILIHGFNFDTFTWTRNLDALAQHFTVYAPDLWGYGYSTREPLDYGYPLYVEQLRLFMDAMGIAQASLVGHSVGGGVAIAFSETFPARVRRLVLVGANGMPHDIPLMGKLLSVHGVGEFVMGRNVDFFRRFNIRRFWVADGALVTDAFFAAQSRFQKIEGSTAVVLAFLRRRFFHTLRDTVQQLGQADVPKLLVWGAQDALVPLRLGQAMHALLPGSQFEVMPGAGHMPNYESPEAFNMLVTRFLT